jgi:hypothetical protein
MVVRSTKWPGRAHVIVSLVAIHNGTWKGRRSLDGDDVSMINAFFENGISGGDPMPLPANAAKLFQGSIFLGDGFLLSHEEAARLISTDSRNHEVIFPVINGKEANNGPDQKPARSIINFHDWSMERAATYKAPFEIVERFVKPCRAINNRALYRDNWWVYAERRPGLYSAIRPLSQCFVTARVTKHLNFSALPTNYVYLNNLYVLTTDRWDVFAVVQSTLHEAWARKYSMSLKQDLQYSPSDCFVTFAFPEGLWQTANPALAAIGERYHQHRKSLMLSLWLGLTDIYNLFHARDLSPARVAKVSKKPEAEAERGYHGILELRRLHRELDLAIRDAYGWQNLDLGHDFHEVETLAENDRVRYTISPAARKEVLRRLLALNHTRAEEEATKAPGKTGKRQRKPRDIDAGGGLFT